MFAPTTIPDYAKSAEYLKELAKLHGEFTMDLQTRKYFDSWYKEFRSTIENNTDKTGTLNRFDDSVLKVAMLISLGEAPDLVISRSSLERAIEHCEKLVGNIRRTTLGQGKSQWATEKALLIEELLRRDGHAISRQQLNKKYWMNANADEWDAIALSLEVAGVLKIEQHGSTILFVMPPLVVQEWENHMKGKNK